MIALVTGGAGFIGSHICRRLVKEGHQVVAIDNLSNGCMNNLKGLEDNSQFSFYEFDINNIIRLKGVFEKHHFDMVFHLAANADAGQGMDSPQIDFENTFQTTLSVLEMMREYEIKKFFFASSSTVYGNTGERLQEHRSIMRPISHYGAAKLASEAFISSFSHLHGFQVWVARLGNAVGPNMTHGVIHDLINKIKVHPEQLEVFGDGSQTKPYIYIDDLVDGIMCILERSNEDYNAYLVGVDSNVTVTQIAQIVMEETNIQVPIKHCKEYKGWKGDVCNYQYDVTRLRMLGWTPKYTAEESVRKAIKENLNN